MKTTAAKKISRAFLLMLMAGFMLLMLPSASSKKNISVHSGDKCFYLLRHVIGGPNNPNTVPIFVTEDRLEFHLKHGDTFILPDCIPSIGDIVNDPPHGPIRP